MEIFCGGFGFRSCFPCGDRLFYLMMSSCFIGSRSLRTVQREIKDLDTEIQNLSRELDSSEYDYSENADDYDTEANAQSYRLFNESIKVLEKRTHRLERNDWNPEMDPIFKKPTRKIPNYQPPSQRITETMEKRRRFIAKWEEDDNEKFQRECPFTPKKYSRTPERKRWINKSTDFLAKIATEKKQVTPKKRADPETIERLFATSVSRKTLSQCEEPTTPRKYSHSRRMYDSAVIPKKQFSEEEEEDAHEVSKCASRRMYESATVKMIPQEEKQAPECTFRPELNESSRKIASKTPRKYESLYEQSIRENELKREKRKQMKAYYRDQELIECTFRPQITKMPETTRDDVYVAGMKNYVRRMNDSRSEISEIRVAPRLAKTPTPKRKYIEQDPRINDILAEVDSQVSFLSSLK